MILNYDNVEQVVSRQQERGINVRWSGWNLIYFTPKASAVYSKDGHRYKGQWGYETVYVPNDKGNWVRVE